MSIVWLALIVIFLIVEIATVGLTSGLQEVHWRHWW